MTDVFGCQDGFKSSCLYRSVKGLLPTPMGRLCIFDTHVFSTQLRNKYAFSLRLETHLTCWQCRMHPLTPQTRNKMSGALSRISQGNWRSRSASCAPDSKMRRVPRMPKPVAKFRGHGFHRCQGDSEYILRRYTVILVSIG